MFGFYRIAAAVPLLKVADVDFNVKQIVHLIHRAEKYNACFVVFPELGVCGYSCGDLFHQTQLIDVGIHGIEKISSEFKNSNIVIAIGLPLFHCGRLYNCALVLQKGEIKGIVPKSTIPNYKEFYEKRWFQSGSNIKNQSLNILRRNFPFGIDLLFESGPYFRLGIEICEDLWNVIPRSSYHALAGANVLANLSASTEFVAKADYRRDLVKNQSARCLAAYIYSSSGVTESTSDVVYGGHSIIAENGVVLAEGKRFQRENSLVFSDIDCQRLVMTRKAESSISDQQHLAYRIVGLDKINNLANVNRTIDPYPFVPSNLELRNERCQEIINIQTAGLAKRIEHTQSKTAVLGVSGGLDSTHALLVTSEAFKLIGKGLKNIITVTLPGFGTSPITYTNAKNLCELLNTDFREIDIKPACHQHFKDIALDDQLLDTTYENAQARERTQILMDIANKEKGLVIGTGDLSEIALGWSTYNGDHMSMYAVNCGVPKTLIQYLIRWFAEHGGEKLKKTLDSILDVPITPELLPNTNNNQIDQKTEELIGPYELHDFFLYHIVKYGAPPEKILFLALRAFDGKYSKRTIKRWLKLFVKRFFSNQFKRSCIPDGPKVGTISLSPRGDWRMPSDASYKIWLESI